MAYIVNGVEVDANGKPLNAPADAPAGDLASLKAEHEAKEAEWTTQRDGLLVDLADSLKREDALKARALPADALDRLKRVDGIGDKLAQKALDALTAQEG